MCDRSALTGKVLGSMNKHLRSAISVLSLANGNLITADRSYSKTNWDSLWLWILYVLDHVLWSTCSCISRPFHLFQSDINHRSKFHWSNGYHLCEYGIWECLLMTDSCNKWHKMLLNVASVKCWVAYSSNGHRNAILGFLWTPSCCCTCNNDLFALVTFETLH